MATPVDPAYRARLAALNEKFAASVPQRMAAIAQALAQCRERGATPEHLRQLHESLHAVAGSAGSFGFQVLGEQARRLEQQLRGLQAGEGDWTLTAAEIDTLLTWAAQEPSAQHYPPQA
ncbi:Hpt domain-containing protein [Massilia sp. YIM B04103]|uniref:Hpt domain-containing protein n=1 Tax=Massilia sp. YIM B04103 TaxID=2963106 RepID=UPI00210E66F0|nr:Hpt domain-containing protein [Massilia sp. YIM B04103]